MSHSRPHSWLVAEVELELQVVHVDSQQLRMCDTPDNITIWKDI